MCEPTARREFRAWSLLLLLVVLLYDVGMARAQSWILKHEFENRYEGQIELPAGAADLEVLSFTGSLEPFQQGEPVDLTVEFYLPHPAPVFIEGRELLVRRFYRMESKPAECSPEAWNEFGPWETSAVLDTLGISFRNLGVTVRLQSPRSDVLAPAFVWHSRPATQARYYSLLLRPGSTLSSVTYALVGDEGNAEPIARVTLQGERTVGQPFVILIDAEPLPAGFLTVVVTGRYKAGSGGPVRELRFYHQPLRP